MKPTDEMYAAAIEAFLAESRLGAVWKCCVRAAVDAALALVPVVTVDGELAWKVYFACDMPRHGHDPRKAMLAALREVLPTGPFAVDPGTGFTALEQAEARIKELEEREESKPTPAQKALRDAIARLPLHDQLLFEQMLIDELRRDYKELREEHDAQTARADKAESRVKELEQEVEDLGVKLSDVEGHAPDGVTVESLLAEVERLKAEVRTVRASHPEMPFAPEYVRQLRSDRDKAEEERDQLALAVGRMQAAVSEVAAQRDRYREQLLQTARPETAADEHAEVCDGCVGCGRHLHRESGAGETEPTLFQRVWGAGRGTTPLSEPDEAPEYDREGLLATYKCPYDQAKWSASELASLCEAVCTAMLKERGL